MGTSFSVELLRSIVSRVRINSDVFCYRRAVRAEAAFGGAALIAARTANGFRERCFFGKSARDRAWRETKVEREQT